jgi:hypothetical protein
VILPAHLDCPVCPHCSAPCGCSDEVPAGRLRCGACGDTWLATAAELAQSRRADTAYVRHRSAEEEAEREAAFVSGLPPKLRVVNRRMLEAIAHSDVKPDNAEQLDLLAPRSS